MHRAAVPFHNLWLFHSHSWMYHSFIHYGPKGPKAELYCSFIAWCKHQYIHSLVHSLRKLHSFTKESFIPCLMFQRQYIHYNQEKLRQREDTSLSLVLLLKTSSIHLSSLYLIALDYATTNVTEIRSCFFEAQEIYSLAPYHIAASFITQASFIHCNVSFIHSTIVFDNKASFIHSSFWGLLYKV